MMILTFEQNLDFEELLVVQLLLVGTQAVKGAVITPIMVTAKFMLRHILLLQKTSLLYFIF